MTDPSETPFEQPTPVKLDPKRRWRVPRDANRLVIVLACLVGLLVAALIPSVVLLAVALNHAQTDIRKTQQKVTISRVETARSVCEAININATASNHQTDFLKNLVVAGAQQGRIFEDLYKRFGAPSYAERLKEAQATADGLESRKVPVLPCDRFADAVAHNQAPPRPQRPAKPKVTPQGRNGTVAPKTIPAG